MRKLLVIAAHARPRRVRPGSARERGAGPEGRRQGRRERRRGRPGRGLATRPTRSPRPRADFLAAMEPQLEELDRQIADLEGQARMKIRRGEEGGRQGRRRPEGSARSPRQVPGRREAERHRGLGRHAEEPGRGDGEDQEGRRGGEERAAEVGPGVRSLVVRKTSTIAAASRCRQEIVSKNLQLKT